MPKMTDVKRVLYTWICRVCGVTEEAIVDEYPWKLTPHQWEHDWRFIEWRGRESDFCSRACLEKAHARDVAEMYGSVEESIPTGNVT